MAIHTTFYLRKGVKFHNGAEFKADDVLFTIDKMMNPEEKTLNTDTFEMIAGAKEERANALAERHLASIDQTTDRKSVV